jgi:hypothetical protein
MLRILISLFLVVSLQSFADEAAETSAETLKEKSKWDVSSEWWRQWR